VAAAVDVRLVRKKLLESRKTHYNRGRLYFPNLFCVADLSGETTDLVEAGAKREHSRLLIN